MAFWDTVGEMGRDPRAWLAALSTGGGLYYNIAAQQAQNRAYRRNLDASRAYQTAIGNYGTMYQDYANRALGAQQEHWNRMFEAAMAPVDWRQFYEPMSELGQAAILRGAKAGLASRGIQPGGYWDSMTSEVLARTEQDRYLAAVDAAARARSAQLGGLGGLSAPIGVPPAAPIPYNMPNAPAYISGLGDMSGLGSYFNMLAREKASARESARQNAMNEQWYRIMDNLTQPRTYQSPS